MKRRKDDYASFLVLSNFTERFKQKDGVLNNSVIMAVTKSSMKSQSSTTANCHLRGSGERNGEQRIALQVASTGAAMVGEKVHLRMKRR